MQSWASRRPAAGSKNTCPGVAKKVFPMNFTSFLQQFTFPPSSPPTFSPFICILLAHGWTLRCRKWVLPLDWSITQREMQFSFIARGQQQPQHLTINIECSQLSSLLLAHSQYAGVTWNWKRLYWQFCSITQVCIDCPIGNRSRRWLLNDHDKRVLVEKRPIAISIWGARGRELSTWMILDSFPIQLRPMLNDIDNLMTSRNRSNVVCCSIKLSIIPTADKLQQQLHKKEKELVQLRLFGPADSNLLAVVHSNNVIFSFFVRRSFLAIDRPAR